MITNFNDLSIRTLRREVEQALADVAKRHGLRASTLGNISYTGSVMTTGKLTFSTLAAVPQLEGPLESFIGRRFKQGSREFRILRVENGKLVGITNRSKSYIIRRDQLAEMIEIK